MVIKRGEIWWAELPEPKGSEPGYRRPVLIVSSNDFNNSQIRTILAVVVSSNLALADAPGNVKMSQEDTGLTKDSVANVSQLVTIDKIFLTELVVIVPAKVLRQIEDGLRLVMKL